MMNGLDVESNGMQEALMLFDSICNSQCKLNRGSIDRAELTCLVGFNKSSIVRPY